MAYWMLLRMLMLGNGDMAEQAYYIDLRATLCTHPAHHIIAWLKSYCALPRHRQQCTAIAARQTTGQVETGSMAVYHDTKDIPREALVAKNAVQDALRKPYKTIDDLALGMARTLSGRA